MKNGGATMKNGDIMRGDIMDRLRNVALMFWIIRFPDHMKNVG